MSSTRRAVLLTTGIVVALLASPVRAATTAHRVRVVDPSGAVVPRAEVTLNCSNGPASSVLTNGAGEAVLPAPDLAACALRVRARGFEPAAQSPVTADPTGLVVLSLSLPRREEKMTVEADRGEALSRERSFSQVLTPDDIAALPDDPEEMEAELRRRAGPGATVHVNGFAGGRLPPKSQIRQIRIQTNRYAAEYHEGGHPVIDIVTKPGLGSWRTSVGGGLRDGAWGAGPALASHGQAESAHRLSLTLDGPLRKDTTSLSVQLQERDTADVVAVTAVAADARTAVRTPQHKLDLQGRLEHAWGRAQTARAEVQHDTHDRDGLGAGGLALPERAYAEDRAEDLFRLSNSGVVFGKWGTETRLQLRREGLDWTPRTVAPAIDVLGAFSAGGAPLSGSRTEWSLEWGQDLPRSLGRHTLRGGLLYVGTRVKSGQRRNAEGTFTFGSLEDWRAGRPLLFTQRTGEATVAFDLHRAGLYVQDDWRPSDALAVNAGVRYEAQSFLEGRPDLAPRFGLTWAARPGLTVRAGGGVFFDWLEADTVAQVRAGDGSRGRETSIEDPGWPEALATGSADGARARRWGFAPDLPLSRVARASIGFERSLGAMGRFSAEYAYERGRDVLRARNVLERDGGRLFEVRAEGRSRAHTLRTDVMLGGPGRRAGGMVGYMLHRGWNDADGPLALPAGEPDLAAEWGPSPDDVRHRVFGFGHWRVAGRLRVSGQVFAQSGAPWDAITGRDDNGDTVANDRAPGARRNALRGGWTADLGLRLAWSFGFGGRRGPQGPQVIAVRLGGGDDAPPDVGGGDDRRYGVQLYATVANALNHLNPTRYGNVIGSPRFGQPVEAATARRVEIGARFGF